MSDSALPAFLEGLAHKARPQPEAILARLEQLYGLSFSPSVRSALQRYDTHEPDPKMGFFPFESQFYWADPNGLGPWAFAVRHQLLDSVMAGALPLGGDGGGNNYLVSLHPEQDEVAMVRHSSMRLLASSVEGFARLLRAWTTWRKHAAAASSEIEALEC